MNFRLLVSSLLFLCFVTKGTSAPKNCEIGDRTLKHGESGPAALGKCELVECKSGRLSTLMQCGVIQPSLNCSQDVIIRDFTKLYPDCCVHICDDQ